MKKIFTALSLMALASCGGGSSGNSSSNSSKNGSGSASVAGSVLGQSLNTQEALSMPIDSSHCSRPFGALTNATGALIWMSSINGTCDLQANSCKVQPNALTLVLVPWNAASSGAPPAIAPGVFPVTPNPIAGADHGAFVAVLATDASCTLTSRLPGASGGNVTITAVHGAALTGSFDLTLTDGSTVSGSFNTTECKVDPAPVCNGTFACSSVLQCG